MQMHNLNRTAPLWAPDAIATAQGWKHPVTGELLVSIVIDADILSGTPAPVIVAPIPAPVEPVAEVKTPEPVVEPVAEVKTPEPAVTPVEEVKPQAYSGAKRGPKPKAKPAE